MSTLTIVDTPDPAATGEHGEVAERFAYFLEVSGLDREAFVEQVDGAIGARSLYAVLSGRRRPSRALAVLVERTWGFRADFLLHGSGPMWAHDGDRSARPASTASASTPADGLSPAERDVVHFMRSSVEHAKSMRIELDKARLWSTLFDRTLGVLGQLEGHVDDEAQMALIALVLDDCQRSARVFERYVVALHRRRTMRLTTMFLDRYLSASRLRVRGAGAQTLRDARRAVGDAARDLDAEIDSLRRALTALTEMVSPDTLVGSDPDAAAAALAGIVRSTLPLVAP